MQSAVGAVRGRAWIFASTRDDSWFTEFVEWQTTSSDTIIDDADITAALDSLNAAFPYEESDTWKEAGL